MRVNHNETSLEHEFMNSASTETAIIVYPLCTFRANMLFSGCADNGHLFIETIK